MPSGLRASILALLFGVLAAPTAAQERLVFGVVPQQSAARMAAMWTPLLTALAQKTGVGIAFATARDIPTFEACLDRGAYDVAYMNPFHYVVYRDRAGYRAFARRGGAPLQGLLVVRRGDAVNALSDLDGATLAFPGPGSFGASILIQAELARQGVSITPLYVGSHDSVYRAVASGLATAGGGVIGTLATAPAATRRNLRVLHETEGYSPHAFAAAPHVSPEVVAALADALVATSRDAPDVVRTAGFETLQRASDAAYDDIRALPLSPDRVTTKAGTDPLCQAG